jgi:hypothetical protein
MVAFPRLDNISNNIIGAINAYNQNKFRKSTVYDAVPAVARATKRRV